MITKPDLGLFSKPNTGNFQKSRTSPVTCLNYKNKSDIGYIIPLSNLISISFQNNHAALRCSKPLASPARTTNKLRQLSLPDDGRDNS